MNIRDLKSRLSYTCVEIGANIPNAFASYFLLAFFTDVFLLPALPGAVMLFIYRVIAALNDIPAGIYMNRKTFKQGKYRPYYLYLCIPFALFTAFSYFTPDLGEAGKLFYAFFMLIIWDILFTFINSATLSLLPHISADKNVRAKINSLRIIFSVFTFMAVSSLAPLLIDFFGSQSIQRGFFLTACIMGLASMFPHLIGYYSIKEKPYLAESQNKIPVKALINKVWRHKMMLTLMAAYFFFFAGGAFRDQMTFYYVNYRLASPHALSLVMLMGILPVLPVHLAVPKLLKFAKAETYMLSGLIGMFVTFALIPVFGQSLNGFLVLRFLHGAFSALPANLIFLLVAAFVDEELHKNQLNISEVFYTALSFCARLGPAFVLSLSWLLLDFSGYVERAPLQSGSALWGIDVLFIGCSCVMFVLSSLFMMYFVMYYRRRRL